MDSSFPRARAVLAIVYAPQNDFSRQGKILFTCVSFADAS
jgi:hypothetical protein